MLGGTAPYGAWPSPISPESLAAGSVRVTTLVADGADLWWSETRPAAKGRTALVRRSADGSVREMTPPDANVRSRVHSYGGAAWWAQGRVCVYSDDSDFRLRRIDADDGEPVVLTPEGPDRSCLYADGRLSADGRWFVCVRERPADPEHVNEIVRVALDG
ncbi:MAG: S9 family peptidase, partial [Acidimicrobiia bacterium]|nr:S9 family peptidase [Acidimicrobiia bacterium]